MSLTGLSSVLAAATIPLLARLFELALGRPLGFQAPLELLVFQLLGMLAVPVGLGMWVRRRWPSLAEGRRPLVQRSVFVAVAVLLLLVIGSDFRRFADGLAQTVPVAASFISASFAVGWWSGAALRAEGRDRFTLATEFATRNIAVATTIAVTLLGRVEFALFATTYFLVEFPLMLAAIALFRRRASLRGAVGGPSPSR